MMKSIEEVTEEALKGISLTMELGLTEDQRIQLEKQEKEIERRNLSYVPVSEALEKKIFDWKFETFNDKVLVNLLDSIIEWCKVPNRKKAMITISGPTEVGKSHLLKRVKILFETFDCSFKKKESCPDVLYIEWIEFTRKCLNDPSYVDKVKGSGLVIIEDFLSDVRVDKVNNYTEIAVAKAFEVLNGRVGKPTIIDTNKSISDFQEIDKRIYSRLFRENGLFIDIPSNTIPYLDRK